MKMITRHNYEEFFILYMDNELNAGDRRMVEEFVQKHPDLREELELLMQFKLQPDTDIVFNGKEELLKAEGQTPLSLSNYPEWLTLYIDNELSPAEKISVEQFAAANPAVQKELNLLQQVKLQPETIVFTNKESLYRREEKVRPVIYFRWWRVAAAILIIAAGLTTYLLLNKRTENSSNLANGNNPVKNISPEKTPVQINSNNASVQQVAVNVDPANQVNPVANSNTAERKQDAVIPANNPKEDQVALKNDKNVPVNNLPANNNTVIKDNSPVVVDNNPNNIPKPLNNPNVNTPNKNSNPFTQAQTPVPDEFKDPKNSLTNAVVTNGSSKPSDIIQANNPVTETDPEFAKDNGKKGKLRGLLRKVTRTFEKRTNIDATDGDDRLLVAGLALKMK